MTARKPLVMSGGQIRQLAAGDTLDIGVVYVDVYGSIDQSIVASNTYVKMVLNAENENTGNAFNTSNSRFTAPYAGIYMISAGAYFQWPLTDQHEYGLVVYKNGVSLPRNYCAWKHASGTAGTYVNLGALPIRLAQNDDIEIHLYSMTPNVVVVSRAAQIIKLY